MCSDITCSQPNTPGENQSMITNDSPVVRTTSQVTLQSTPVIGLIARRPVRKGAVQSPAVIANAATKNSSNADDLPKELKSSSKSTIHTPSRVSHQINPFLEPARCQSGLPTDAGPETHLDSIAETNCVVTDGIENSSPTVGLKHYNSQEQMTKNLSSIELPKNTMLSRNDEQDHQDFEDKSSSVLFSKDPVRTDDDHSCNADFRYTAASVVQHTHCLPANYAPRKVRLSSSTEYRRKRSSQLQMQHQCQSTNIANVSTRKCFEAVDDKRKITEEVESEVYNGCPRTANSGAKPSVENFHPSGDCSDVLKYQTIESDDSDAEYGFGDELDWIDVSRLPHDPNFENAIHRKAGKQGACSPVYDNMFGSFQAFDVPTSLQQRKFLNSFSQYYSNFCILLCTFEIIPLLCKSIYSFT